ncbi:hypothetical protein E3T37_03470 [Cryobacterium sp. TMT2-10]|uniref:hypothetical protein n=1 Tax=Cryobacterium sp. TMT2-10 TaxID=1259244 RepID=UPI00106AB0C2|nr:hypothetical protein [Cryobacterium sp. TMT2-10]TFD41724.1 hypothetical protein E3T37_03470 [Cryobacterium sp. TMT2-10]
MSAPVTTNQKREAMTQTIEHVAPGDLIIEPTERAAEMLGFRFTVGTAAAELADYLDRNPAKAERVLTALAVLHNESNLNAATWQQTGAQIGVYFAQLAAWGYGVSEVEESLIPVPVEIAAALDDDDDEDEGCRNPECDDTTADGEGWDGLCGNCADRAEGGEE